MKIAGGAVLGPLRRAFDGESVSGLDEGELLDRFLFARDEPSFEALVARLGPMVLGVCRRILVEPADVEDAFQATFLVLVRRGATLRDRDRLAPWLFGVARKVATRARADSLRRRAREHPLAGDLAATPILDDPGRELARALVEEIDRLPDSLRAAVVLCCGEGLSYEDAAARLRSTVPAVRGRLARARDRLRGRLGRRGFAPTAGLLAPWAGSEGKAALMISGRLIDATTRAATATAAGTMATAGMVPATVASLAEGATRTMILSKWKFLGAGAMTLGVASGVGVLAQQPAMPPSPAAQPFAAQPFVAETRPAGRTITRVREVFETGPDGRQVGRQIEETEMIPAGQASNTTPATPEVLPPPTPTTHPLPSPSQDVRVETRTVPAPAESGRLEALESKLDRLLQTLAKAPDPVVPPPGRSNPPPARSKPRAVATPDQAAIEAGELDDRPAATARRQSPPQPPTTPVPARSSRTPAVEDAPARGGTMISRIESIEGKLERLEARFAEMERKLGIQTGEEANSPPLFTTSVEEPFLQPIPSPTYTTTTVPAPETIVVPPQPSDVGPLENYKPRPR